jgi:Restriction endonuclease BglII
LVRLFFSRESSYSGAHGDAPLILEDIAADYEVHEWRNATGVLQTAHLSEWQDIIAALRTFQFRRSELLKGGGAKSIIAQRIDSFLTARQWKEKKFATKIRVDAEEWDSPTHKVDCFKGHVGLEIEWNNKVPFYDRDLNNFRLLFDLRVIEVGVIVTRASNLQTIFRSLGPKVGNKYGASTTHMEKLLPRIEGGGGGGCPILAFGITSAKYVEDNAPIVSEQASENGDEDSE